MKATFNCSDWVGSYERGAEDTEISCWHKTCVTWWGASCVRSGARSAEIQLTSHHIQDSETHTWMLPWPGDTRHWLRIPVDHQISNIQVYREWQCDGEAKYILLGNAMYRWCISFAFSYWQNVSGTAHLHELTLIMEELQLAEALWIQIDWLNNCVSANWLTPCLHKT